MKTIGIIGGMSWESSLTYYKLLNESIRDQLGGFHSCKCLMYSVDFSYIEELQHEGKWEKLTEIMISIAGKLENAGAEVLIIATNTMHLMAPEVERSIRIPLIHIADATGFQIQKQHLKKVGLLGTRFTMEKDFYKKRLSEKYGIEVVTPDSEDMEIVHHIIYEELVKGKIEEQSKLKYLAIIEKLANRGAQGIILGCTEIPLLIKQKDCSIPLFDTTTIHAERAVEFAIQ